MKIYRFFTWMLIFALLEGSLMAFVAPAPTVAHAASIGLTGGTTTPDGAPTPDPRAKPSYEFKPGDITVSACEKDQDGNLVIAGSLLNTASEAKDYALGVQLGSLVDRGDQYVKSVEITPAYIERIEARETVLFTVKVTLKDSFSSAPAGDEIKVRIFVASAINRPDHLFGRLTITITGDCKPTKTVTTTPTETVTPKPSKTPCPTDTVTPTETETPTETVTPTETETPTETVTPTETETPTETVTPTETETPTETVTPTETETPTETVTPTETETPTETVTPTETETPTETVTVTPTETVTVTPTETVTVTPTETVTVTPTETVTVTVTPTETVTVTPTPVVDYFCLSPNSATANTLYLNNFDAEAPGPLGWSKFTADTAPAGQHFLGQFGNETVTLKLACLPEHTQVHLEFDLYIIRSWDGNYSTAPWRAPDFWNLKVDGQQYIHTTFTNYPNFTQAYPKNYPDGSYTGPTGTVAVRSLGYSFGGLPMDSVYHISLNIPHSQPEITIDFSGEHLQALTDESWGLDNFTAQAMNNAPDIFLPLAMGLP